MTWVFIFLIGFFLLAPLVGLLLQFNLSIFLDVFHDPAFTKSMGVTLLTSLSASLFSTFLALLFARQFALFNWRGKRLQRLLLLMPFLIPNFILAISFIIAWDPTSGLLNLFFKFPGGLYGILGMVVIFTIAHMPVAFLLLEDRFKKIERSLMPTIVSAMGLCFSLNISAFAIPAWISAPAKVYPLTYKIYQSIQIGGLDGLAETAAYTLWLLLLALIPLIFVAALVRQEKNDDLLSTKGSRQKDLIQSSKSFISFQSFYFISQLVCWMAPLACLFLSTVSQPGCLHDDGLRCLKEISFARYHYVLFELAETKAALRGSLLYGSVASFLIIVLSLLTLGILSHHHKKLKIMSTLYSIPLATPGAIIALGLIVLYSGRFGINLYNTAWIVVMAFVIKHINLAFQPILTAYGNLSPSLVEAARVSDGDRKSVWFKIIFSNLAPEILGSLFLVMIPILGELTMAIFLASAAFKNIGTVLFDLRDYADQASAGALSVLLVLMIVLLNEMAYRLSRGKLGY